MERLSSGSTWEERSGYSRAVVSNGFVFVSATAATGQDGEVLCKGDLHGQTRAIFLKLEEVLTRAGSGLDRVVQTRLYITDIARWAEAGRAHAEVFGDARPAMSLVHVLPFLDPDMLIEGELVAAVG
ncbi:RidA family protein [Sinirhodobacter populi]|uniref:RidA family protein n=1 Tax=Paenirhodobacter populi TaxID=2306993 RepID=A0A443KGI8_9RHOB|nr:Rid family hydrolase [Sinirhodobacter populi]RWR31882.1 RidA family protein [Sinirhodobacter populi]